MADSRAPAAFSTPIVDWPDWPKAALEDDLLPFVAAKYGDGCRLALATLITVDGSSPRPLGAEMAIADDGEYCSYVSGGCIEASVVAEAQAVLAGGSPKRLVYGRGSPFVDIELACGGRIEVFVRCIEDVPTYLHTLGLARSERRTLTVHTRLDDGGMRYHNGVSSIGLVVPSEAAEFRRHHLPTARVVLVGGGPEALAVARLAAIFGLDVVLLRPNGPSHPPALAVALRYERGPLSEWFSNEPPDECTAVYALSHDLDLDAAALRHALNSKAFVVGALGSRGRASLLRTRLRLDGINEAALSRLQAPAGMHLGASTPLEIALSILAQVIDKRPR